MLHGFTQSGILPQLQANLVRGHAGKGGKGSRTVGGSGEVSKAQASDTGTGHKQGQAREKATSERGCSIEGASAGRHAVSGVFDQGTDRQGLGAVSRACFACIEGMGGWHELVQLRANGYAGKTGTHNAATTLVLGEARLKWRVRGIPPPDRARHGRVVSCGKTGGGWRKR